MKLSNRITKHQEGGQAPAPAAAAPTQDPNAAPAQAGGAEGGQDPVAQLVQMAQEALQSQNCEAAMAVCDGLLSILSQAQGGGGAAPEPQGAPVYRKGGVLIRRN